MKKRKWLVLIGLLIVVIVAALWYFKPVGTVEGPEWDILHIDGITYISEGHPGSAERGQQDLRPDPYSHKGQSPQRIGRA